MAGRTGYEPAWDSDSSLGRHQLELEERVELLLFLNELLPLATVAATSRRRNTTSLKRRRLTTSFYASASRCQPHSEQPVEKSPRRS